MNMQSIFEKLKIDWKSKYAEKKPDLYLKYMECLYLDILTWFLDQNK